MKKCLGILCIICCAITTFSQNDSVNIYKTNLVKDGAIITSGIALTALGVKLINDKKTLNPAELVNKTKESS